MDVGDPHDVRFVKILGMIPSFTSTSLRIKRAWNDPSTVSTTLSRMLRLSSKEVWLLVRSKSTRFGDCVSADENSVPWVVEYEETNDEPGDKNIKEDSSEIEYDLHELSDLPTHEESGHSDSPRDDG